MIRMISVKAVVEFTTRYCGWLSPCHAFLGPTKLR